VVGKHWQGTNISGEFDPRKSVVCVKLCYSAFWFWDCITYFNEISLFNPFFCFEIERCFFVKVITWHYITIHDWINIMGKVIELYGALCKILRGNPHLFLKLIKLTFITDFMGLLKTFQSHQFWKIPFAKIILKNLNLLFNFRNNLMFV
jgi:hypothetical protein